MFVIPLGHTSENSTSIEGSVKEQARQITVIGFSYFGELFGKIRRRRVRCATGRPLPWPRSARREEYARGTEFFKSSFSGGNPELGGHCIGAALMPIKSIELRTQAKHGAEFLAYSFATIAD